MSIATHNVIFAIRVYPLPANVSEMLMSQNFYSPWNEAWQEPKIDSQQDYELLSLKVDNGKTTMKFKRKLDTCDPQDNKIEVGTY